MKILDTNLLRITATGVDLVGQQCRACARIAYPRKRVCPQCFSADLDEYILSRRGTLHTFTTTYLGSPNLPAPYSIGFVDLPEGIKLMGMIRVAQPAADRLKVGMEMDIVLDRLRQDENGEDVYCYMLAPAAQETVQ